MKPKILSLLDGFFRLLMNAGLWGFFIGVLFAVIALALEVMIDGVAIILAFTVVCAFVYIFISLTKRAMTVAYEGSVREAVKKATEKKRKPQPATAEGAA